MGRDVSDAQHAMLYLSPDEMVVYRNVFHLGMEDWILAEVRCAYVITVHRRS